MSTGRWSPRLVSACRATMRTQSARVAPADIQKVRATRGHGTTLLRARPCVSSLVRPLQKKHALCCAASCHPMLSYAASCSAVQWRAVPWPAMSCRAVPRCAVLCRAVLSLAVWCRARQRPTFMGLNGQRPVARQQRSLIPIFEAFSSPLASPLITSGINLARGPLRLLQPLLNALAGPLSIGCSQWLVCAGSRSSRTFAA